MVSFAEGTRSHWLKCRCIVPKERVCFWVPCSDPAGSPCSTTWHAHASAGVSPLSPVLKSLLADNEPAAVLHRGRESLMRRIESRFRFLAVRLLLKLRYRLQLRNAMRFVAQPRNLSYKCKDAQ